MNDIKALVSIIVPVYKVEQYLERCIESLLKQTYKQTEIILVDDGSPDKCPEICDLYAGKYEQIKVIHKENGGLSSARKAGFKSAMGEYILFIDSDDYIDENMAKKLIESIQERDADIALCGYCTKYKNSISENFLPYKQEEISGKENIINNYILPLIGNAKNAINVPGFLWIRMLKKELIKEDYFVSENEYFMEDHVFDLRYADSIKKIAIVNEPLYLYCVNNESLSNRYRKNKWTMHMKFLSFYLTYLSERDIEKPDERIDGFIMTSIFSCIDNAVLGGDYCQFKIEMEKIKIEEKVVGRFFEISKARLSDMQKIERALFKYNAYKMLYKIRRKRLQYR